MTEYQLSHWISQSLAGELSEQQRAELQAALERSPASQVFAEWSSRIQAAAAQGEPDIVAEEQRFSPVSPDSLSEFSKERMRRALRAAQSDYQNDNSQQQHLSVAQSPADYLHGRPETSSNDSMPHDSRELQSTRIQQPGVALIVRGRSLRERLNSQFSSRAVAGSAITENDIESLLRAEIEALGIEENVLLIDHQGQILFSSLAARRNELEQIGQTLSGWENLLRKSPDSGEKFFTEHRMWVTTITLPAPLASMYLVLRPNEG